MTKKSNNFHYIVKTFARRGGARALDWRLALAKPDAVGSSSGIGMHDLVEGKPIALGNTSAAGRRQGRTGAVHVVAGDGATCTGS